MTPATQPTLFFIGVTTGQSSIMRVFPVWAAALGLKDAIIKGMDFPLHADPEAYRKAVRFICNDPLSLGALVTTHKLDLFAVCRDLFDEVDPHAAAMHEVSSISKRSGRLIAHAKDPISSGLAIDHFLPALHFSSTGADVFSMGAGGSTIAICWHLMQASRTPNLPTRIVVSNRSQPRLDELRRIHEATGVTVPVEYVLADQPEKNDAVLASMKPGALVINATGMGKDSPGSPLTKAARFPKHAIVWDLNYRGNLVFLDQAREQQVQNGLQIEDGWVYFLHGWTQVIAEVFDIEIPSSGPDFDRLSELARNVGGR